MMKTIAIFCVFLMTTTLARAEALVVAAAVSLKDVLTQIASDRNAAGKGDVEFVFGSSGQLQQQILNGAPVDVFISAGVKQVDDLAAAGAIDPTTRRDVIGNQLALIAPIDSKLTADSLATLDLSLIKKFAIGEPRTVPAGHYASQALKSAGIESSLADRIITAANVRQVLNYVERGEVSAGLVYASDAKLSGDKIRRVLMVDARLHDPIVYPGAVVARSKHEVKAKAFLDDLMRESAQKRFVDFGFASPHTTPATQPAR